MFGFYSEWPFFNNRRLYNEDALNNFPGSIGHHMRVYPVRRNGQDVPNTFLVTTEEYTGNFDFNDIVLLVSNVQPASILEVRNLDSYSLDRNQMRPGKAYTLHY